MEIKNSNNIQIGRKIRTSSKYSGSKSVSFKHQLAKLFTFLKEGFTILKFNIVKRIHWGRSSYYKNLVHTFMVISTVGFLIFNVSSRISSVTTVDSGNLVSSDTVSGTSDLLEQGGNINSVLIQNLETGLVINKYIVQDGDTLETIAAKYNVSTRTIKEANYTKYSALFLGDNIQPGWELSIPEINGFSHEIKPGETLENIIDRYTSDGNTEANRFNIIEFNNIADPENLVVGEVLFIPDGNKAIVDTEVQIGLDSLRGAFIDPLSHPQCRGYTYSRGFTYYHNGVDLAKWNSCPISAVADGIVEYAGYASAGQGYMVRINHGGGIKTEYFHGNGLYFVSAGDVVQQGDILLQMGCTGYCTGTHVHFILWYNKVAIDPAPYVPYTRR